VTEPLRTFDDVRRVCSRFGWNGSQVSPLEEVDVARLEGFAEDMRALGHPLAAIELHTARDTIALCFSSHPYAPSRERQRVRVSPCMPGPTGWTVADASRDSDEDDAEFDWEDQGDATNEVVRRLGRPAFVQYPDPAPIAIGTTVYLPRNGVAVPFQVVNALPVPGQGDVPDHLTVRLRDATSRLLPSEEARFDRFTSSLDPGLHRTPTGALFAIVDALSSERDHRLDQGRQYLARWSAQGSRLHELYVELAARHEANRPVTPEIATLVERMFDAFCERRVEDAKDEEHTHKLVRDLLGDT
jgi:hypothetical protein